MRPGSACDVHWGWKWLLIWRGRVSWQIRVLEKWSIMVFQNRDQIAEEINVRQFITISWYLSFRIALFHWKRFLLMALMLHHTTRLAIDLSKRIWRVFIQNWTRIFALISLQVLPIFWQQIRLISQICNSFSTYCICIRWLSVCLWFLIINLICQFFVVF